MTDVWETKDGKRRVRRDPPTIEEAVVAAQGLTPELKEQIELFRRAPARRPSPPDTLSGGDHTLYSRLNRQADRTSPSKTASSSGAALAGRIFLVFDPGPGSSL